MKPAGDLRLDARATPIAAASAATVDRFEDVLDRYLRFGDDPAGALKKLLADDPDFALGRCLKAAFLLYQHQTALAGKIRGELDAIDRLPGGGREREHLRALRAWAAGQWRSAADILDALLLDHPRDLLALKISQDLRFFLGQGVQIRDGVARLLPGWSADAPGYGYALGMYAFGLEESGDYSAAEETGRRALEHNRRDAWAVHAVAHVLEMTGRREDGVRWLGEREADWAPDNFFAVHQWWHLCLFHYDLGDYGAMLALYDREIGPRATELVLNMADASAALWRLYLAGHDVGGRAEPLADAWAAAADNTVYAFNDCHALMAYAMTGRDDAIDVLLDAQARAADRTDDHAAVLRLAGLDIARALAAFGRGDAAGAVELLRPIRYDFTMLGGSHAQRDVFALTLIEAALRADRPRLARALLAERTALRANSRHDAMLTARAAA